MVVHKDFSLTGQGKKKVSINGEVN